MLALLAGSAPDAQRDSFVIVFEDYHGVTEAFQRLGYRCIRHCHRAINTGTTSRVAHDIKQNKVVFLYIEFPVVGKHVKPKEHFAVISQLLSWARLCSDCDVPFLMLGSLGSKWKDPQIATAVADRLLTLAHHRRCAFDLRINNTMQQPSGTCYVSAATIDVRPHRCRCEVKQEDHMMYYKTMNTSSQNRIRDKAQVEVGDRIIQEIIPTLKRKVVKVDLGVSRRTFQTLPDSNNSIGINMNVMDTSNSEMDSSNSR